MAKNQVFISLGTNLGDRIQNLKKAVHAIESNLGEIIKQSSLHESKPWGKSDQPDFLNQVILVQVDNTPQECLNKLSSIERQLGRKRDEKWGPRIIDLDLLYVNDQIFNTEKLILPHPGIPYRRFVLVPMAEIAPDFIHPYLLKNQKQLLEECMDTLEVKVLHT
jgi:2-amino-4-hydroxy-6-hydroxymethyldihydropteridine diphosphokinase